tara:strand:- start:5357 stop:7264 length:1908 start_codon:yes stop_codon:yes gene_type:complete
MDATQLFPLIGLLNGQGGSNQWISTIFVLIVLISLIGFSIWAFHAFKQSCKKISAIKGALKGLSAETLHEKRRDVLNFIKQVDEESGQIWREFDESLVTSDQAPYLRNTLDAEHFFSTHTLSRGLTENRLIAAVPGFLTAVGVIGTFLGLTLGLSGLNIAGGGSTDELTAGIQTMISGASVAFITSVWGVATSLIFNVFEKLLERNIRGKIHELQNKIDYIYPRITAEQSLVQMVEYNKNTDEAIQVLAEKIGDKMQEAMDEVSTSINSSLKNALEEIMSPAIKSLVDNANGGAQTALDGLMERFLEKMGDAGTAQQEMMQSASSDVTAAVGGLSTELSGFVDGFKAQSTEMNKNLDDQFTKMDEREKERASHQEKQLNDLAARSQQLMNQLGTSLKTQFEDQNTAAEQQKSAFNSSIDGMQKTQSDLLTEVTQLIDVQKTTSMTLMDNLAGLEGKLSNMANANEAAANSLNQATREMTGSTNQLGVMATKVQEATNSFADVNKEAVGIMESLTNAHESLLQKANVISDAFGLTQDSITGASKDLKDAAVYAESGLKAVDQNMNKFITDMTTQVENLEAQSAHLLEDFAQRVSDQTRQRMNEWNEQTNQYAASMERAINTINNVVSEIDSKVGAS